MGPWNTRRDNFVILHVLTFSIPGYFLCFLLLRFLFNWKFLELSFHPFFPPFAWFPPFGFTLQHLLHVELINRRGLQFRQSCFRNWRTKMLELCVLHERVLGMLLQLGWHLGVNPHSVEFCVFTYTDLLSSSCSLSCIWPNNNNMYSCFQSYLRRNNSPQVSNDAYIVLKWL